MPWKISGSGAEPQFNDAPFLFLRRNCASDRILRRVSRNDAAGSPQSDDLEVDKALGPLDIGIIIGSRFMFAPAVVMRRLASLRERWRSGCASRRHRPGSCVR